VLPANAGRVVARNFASLGTGEVVARLIAFISTVYLARTLGASAYGVIGFATALTLYLNRITDAGVELGLGVREVAAAPHTLGSLVPSLLTARLIIAALTIGLVAIASRLLLPQPEASVVSLYALTLVAVAISTRWVFLGQERARLVAVTRASGEALMVLLVLVLVRDTGDITRVPLAQFAGDALCAVVLLGVLASRGVSLKPRLDRALLTPLARRSWPLVLGSWFGLMIYNADLIFLRIFQSAAAVGLYAAAYTLISFLVNLGTAYSMSLLPTLTRLRADPAEQRGLYQTAIAHVFAVGLPIAVGGAMLAPKIISMFFGDAYAAAALPLQILFWAVPVALLRDVPIVALMSAGREDRILKLTAAAAGVNLVLNFLLIPRYGLAGAAVATVATEAARMVFSFLLVRSEGFEILDVRRLWRPALAALSMATLLIVTGPDLLLVAVPLGGIAYGLSLGLLMGAWWRRGTPAELKSAAP
jgi:O-antigen/teichoic acid export membrane protein